MHDTVLENKRLRDRIAEPERTVRELEDAGLMTIAPACCQLVVEQWRHQCSALHRHGAAAARGLTLSAAATVRGWGAERRGTPDPFGILSGVNSGTAQRRGGP